MSSDPTERRPGWADETTRLDPERAGDHAADERTVVLREGETVQEPPGDREGHERTAVLDPSAVRDYERTSLLAGTSVMPEERPVSDESGDEDERRSEGGRWTTGVLLVLLLIALLAGLLLGGLLARPAAPQAPTDGDTVPREALEEQQAAAEESLQAAQAQIADRDAQIADRDVQIARLEGQLEAIQQGQADDAGDAALQERQAALDQREAALDAREQALDEREQALDGDSTLPGVNLPEVDLPDVGLPDDEEARNLLERAVDALRDLVS